MDSGEPFAGRAGSSRSHDVIVASMLVALLIGATMTFIIFFQAYRRLGS
jgi:hypothetical protein